MRHKGPQHCSGSGMDLSQWSLWGWVVGQSPRPQRHQGEWRRLSLRSPKSADSPTPLGLHCEAGCLSCVPGWGDSWEHPVGDGQAGGWLVTCSCALSCRCAGHCATGVRGWGQEDHISALLPLRWVSSATPHLHRTCLAPRGLCGGSGAESKPGRPWWAICQARDMGICQGPSPVGRVTPGGALPGWNQSVFLHLSGCSEAWTCSSSSHPSCTAFPRYS